MFKWSKKFSLFLYIFYFVEYLKLNKNDEIKNNKSKIKMVVIGFLDLMFILLIILFFLSLNDKILEMKMFLFLIESCFVWMKESVWLV